MPADKSLPNKSYILDNNTMRTNTLSKAGVEVKASPTKAPKTHYDGGFYGGQKNNLSNKN